MTSEILNQKLFNVVTNEPSSDKRAIAFVDTVTGKNRLVEVNMDGEVIWEWKFPNQLANETDSCCVCLDERKNNQMITLKPCLHKICIECVKKLNSCPLCRSDIKGTEPKVVCKNIPFHVLTKLFQYTSFTNFTCKRPVI